MMKKTFVISLLLVLFNTAFLSAANADRLFPDRYYENEYCPTHQDTQICIDFYKDTGKTPKNGTSIVTDTTTSNSEFVEANIKIVVDGKELAFEQKPLIYNGTTLVPLRKIFEALGATVEWDDGLKLVKAKNQTIEVRIGIGKYKAYVNNVEMPVLVPAQIIKGTTVVPARFIAESFGAKVEWDDTNKTITVSSSAAGKSAKE
ncbi:copper amine oxidase N-terminal domain-containing protein [Paenibacillus sp. P36]|uniref:copper amine oxidase N-terminal domain-containing protein n=1 Tax=Paenibacillus sp. P36 TaxID=3342538 RepID=UPI0038B2CA97